MLKKERIIAALHLADVWIAIIKREIKLLKSLKTKNNFKIKDKRRLGRLIRQRQQAIKRLIKDGK